ncbi:hypothetical protein PoB_000704900 [Plakobranchus ocellatus]|uniref:Uncharacterized protein n=1 Tax=Plakobranchus ocellatus TaxID=259542 RepID=A0AAV3YEP2_9GAST|nr:hypothetical protein PoB_000704900 [Plakobranchus ocellatus]
MKFRSDRYAMKAAPVKEQIKQTVRQGIQPQAQPNLPGKDEIRKRKTRLVRQKPFQQPRSGILAAQKEELEARKTYYDPELVKFNKLPILNEIKSVVKKAKGNPRQDQTECPTCYRKNVRMFSDGFTRFSEAHGII